MRDFISPAPSHQMPAALLPNKSCSTSSSAPLLCHLVKLKTKIKIKKIIAIWQQGHYIIWLLKAH